MQAAGCQLLDLSQTFQGLRCLLARAAPRPSSQLSLGPPPSRHSAGDTDTLLLGGVFWKFGLSFVLSQEPFEAASTLPVTPSHHFSAGLSFFICKTQGPTRHSSRSNLPWL